MFEITAPKRRALLAALRERTEVHDFKMAALAALEPDHNLAPRAKAVAEVLDQTTRNAQNIVKGDTNAFRYWPLVAAPWLDLFTMRGAVLGIQMATGMHPEDIEALLRRHLGPEIQP